MFSHASASLGAVVGGRSQMVWLNQDEVVAAGVVLGTVLWSARVIEPVSYPLYAAGCAHGTLVTLLLALLLRGTAARRAAAVAREREPRTPGPATREAPTPKALLKALSSDDAAAPAMVYDLEEYETMKSAKKKQRSSAKSARASPSPHGSRRSSRTPKAVTRLE